MSTPDNAPGFPYYRETEGDLFESGLPAIGHGCNCKGAMGAGIADEFRRRYPEMFWQYRWRCDKGMFTLGGYYAWVAPGGQVILNLATQPNPGPTASLSAIRRAVGSALYACWDWNIPVLGLPQIGCGLGGLKWDDVRAVLIETACDVGATEIAVVRPAVQPAGKDGHAQKTA